MVKSSSLAVSLFFLDCLDAIASSERALQGLVGPELIHALKG